MKDAMAAHSTSSVVKADPVGESAMPVAVLKAGTTAVLKAGTTSDGPKAPPNRGSPRTDGEEGGPQRTNLRKTPAILTCRTPTSVDDVVLALQGGASRGGDAGTRKKSGARVQHSVNTTNSLVRTVEGETTAEGETSELSPEAPADETSGPEGGPEVSSAGASCFGRELSSRNTAAGLVPGGVGEDVVAPGLEGGVVPGAGRVVAAPGGVVVAPGTGGVVAAPGTGGVFEERSVPRIWLHKEKGTPVRSDDGAPVDPRPPLGLSAASTAGRPPALVEDPRLPLGPSADPTASIQGFVSHHGLNDACGNLLFAILKIKKFGLKKMIQEHFKAKTGRVLVELETWMWIILRDVSDSVVVTYPRLPLARLGGYWGSGIFLPVIISLFPAYQEGMSTCKGAGAILRKKHSRNKDLLLTLTWIKNINGLHDAARPRA